MREIVRQLEKMREALAERESAAELVGEIDIKEYIAPVYYPLHETILSGKYTYYDLPGGRGSGKSSFTALEMIYGIMSDKTGTRCGIVLRKTAATLRDSVYTQLLWAIDIMGAGDLWRATLSPLALMYRPTGAEIVFRGLDDVSKLKSIKPRRGFFAYIWIEEFSELPGENFARSVMQSVARGGAAATVFRTFNPPLSAANWANLMIARPDPRCIVTRTTYLDMPREWIGEDFIAEAERLRGVNEKAYRHEYLGEATGTGGEVFQNITAATITAEEIEQMDYIYAGIDFGFSVDPAVFIVLSYDHKHEKIYLISEIYRKGTSNKELAELVKDSGWSTERAPRVGWLLGKTLQKQTIICDSAEPKSIADLQTEGLAAYPCKKFPGSVAYGIKWLQAREIIIDPARTPEAYREFTNYHYMTTKDGEILADVPDADNHTIDAVRYALDRVINARGVPA